MPPASTKRYHPYAAEYDGHLYVIYSVGPLPANQIRTEQAVIPVGDLKWEKPRRSYPLQSPTQPS